MPLYVFENIETKETFERAMSVTAMESFLEENADRIRIRITTAPALGDSVRLGLRKPSDHFRDRLRQIQKLNTGDGINTF